MTLLICLAMALHDVDGPILCRSGEKIRLAGIGAIELDASRRPGQPGVTGDPFEQRRTMATKVLGARIERDETGPGGHLWFRAPIGLVCDVTGRSYRREVAWCQLPDGRDASCAAIAARVAVRWPDFDRRQRLVACQP